MQELLANMKKRIALNGVLIGIINTLLGACGGIVAVESLKHNSVDQKKAHATSIAIILPMTVFSAIIYLINDKTEVTDSIVFMIPGILGAFCGSKILPELNGNLLRKVFSGFIIYAGVRMLMK
jgi:uncharacterized membrane protein YfcA